MVSDINKLSELDYQIVKALRLGAYFLTDGATIEFKNSNLKPKFNNFQKLLRLGFIVDVVHSSVISGEDKYIIHPKYKSEDSIINPNVEIRKRKMKKKLHKVL